MTTFSQPNANYTEWPFPFDPSDWEKTPPAVQAYLLSLHQRLDQLQQQIDALQGRLDKTSKPPASHPHRIRLSKSPTPNVARHRANAGAKKGHPGSGPNLLEPTEVQHVYPAPCACGQGALGTPTLYHTHQMIELPPIDMQITHFLLHQARCVGGGRLIKAEVPSAYATGYGPRLSGLIGELSGMHGTSRRLMQDFCQSVLRIPIALGAIQKVIDRVSRAILPHYEAIAELARNATVGYIDETPWFCQHTLQWLWTMTTDTVSLFLMHPHRSKEAFFDLIEDWQGILVSDGYGVYQTWVNHRQTCLAHLMRTARGLAENTIPSLPPVAGGRSRNCSACARWRKPRLRVGSGRRGMRRFCTVIGRYHERHDDAGKLARRLQREMASLWVFLCEHGVEATNNRAERCLAIWCAVAQTLRGHRQCQRQPLGRAEFVASPNLPSAWPVDLWRSWLMHSPVCSADVSLISPGSTEHRPTLYPL